MNTQWVHEGIGVVFSIYVIKSLLEKHNLKEDNIENKINDFTDYGIKTCWHNDVLLSHELDDLGIKCTTSLFWYQERCTLINIINK